MDNRLKKRGKGRTRRRDANVEITNASVRVLAR